MKLRHLLLTLFTLLTGCQHNKECEANKRKAQAYRELIRFFEQ